MRGAAAILEIIQERGRKGLPLERVYRLLFNRELFLTAYRQYTGNGGRDVDSQNRCHHRGSPLRAVSLDADTARLHREEKLDEKAPALNASMVG